jgi:hypothetical protein
MSLPAEPRYAHPPPLLERWLLEGLAIRVGLPETIVACVAPTRALFIPA